MSARLHVSPLSRISCSRRRTLFFLPFSSLRQESGQSSRRFWSWPCPSVAANNNTYLTIISKKTKPKRKEKEKEHSCPFVTNPCRFCTPLSPLLVPAPVVSFLFSDARLGTGGEQARLQHHGILIHVCVCVRRVIKSSRRSASSALSQAGALYGEVPMELPTAVWFVCCSTQTLTHHPPTGRRLG